MPLLDQLTWANLIAFFGNRENNEIALQLRELARAATDSAATLKRKGELCESDTVEDEHRGDEALSRIEKALDRAFIVRFGKRDLTRLAHELDDVIDGMRDVARHIETYRKFLKAFPLASSELIEIVQKSVKSLTEMVDELTNGRISHESLNKAAGAIIELERQADVVCSRAERALANSPSINDVRSFIAERDLNHYLEDITDHTKHCAIIILSIARQEA